MGQRIGSELITLVDDGTREKGMASEPFDGEGVPTQKRVIVEKGILKGFLYNTIVAKRAGVQSTGNASRGGFTSLPEIGPHNFYMEAGSAKVEDIIRGDQSRPPRQRSHGLRHQSGQRQLQRRRLGCLDRGRQDRLSGQGPDHRRHGRRDAQRHRHGGRRPRPEPVDDRAHVPDQDAPDRRGIGKGADQTLSSALASIASTSGMSSLMAMRWGHLASHSRQPVQPAARSPSGTNLV